MNKYLILKFENAKLFRNTFKCKDFVFDIYGQKNRSEQQQFIEPITVHQVSNMLHVLFNERPVPTFRPSLYGRVEHYFEMAQESFIRIDSVKRFNKSKNEDVFITEVISTKKAVSNSYNPNPTITWEIVKQYCENDFNEILKLITIIIGSDPLKLTFDDVRNILFNSDIEELMDRLKKLKLSGLANYIDKNKKTKEGKPVNPDSCKTELTKKSSTALINNNGIDNVIVLSGEIIVPVTDDDLARLSESDGCATILDGGMVWIEDVKTDNEISDHGFIKVKEISTETY